MQDWRETLPVFGWRTFRNRHSRYVWGSYKITQAHMRMFTLYVVHLLLFFYYYYYFFNVSVLFFSAFVVRRFLLNNVIDNVVVQRFFFFFLFSQNWLAFSSLHKPMFSEHSSIYFANSQKPAAWNNNAFCKVRINYISLNVNFMSCFYHRLR